MLVGRSCRSPKHRRRASRQLLACTLRQIARLVRHTTGFDEDCVPLDRRHSLMTPMTQAQTATTADGRRAVTDPSGALVVGAKVAVTSDAGVRREVTTGGNGRYTFPLLDPGAYRLKVTQSGFAPAKRKASWSRSPKARSRTSPSRWPVRRPLPTRNFQQLLALTTGTSGSIENASDLGRGDAPLYVNGRKAA